MAVAWQADIFESHVSGLHTCLVEPLRDAMRVRPVITCLARDFENRNTLQVYEFVCRLLLNPAWDEVWAIRLLFTNGVQFGWVLDGRIVMNWKRGYAPKTSRTCRSSLRVLDGWRDWFGREDTLDELWPRISDHPSGRCYA